MITGTTISRETEIPGARIVVSVHFYDEPNISVGRVHEIAQHALDSVLDDLVSPIGVTGSRA